MPQDNEMSWFDWSLVQSNADVFRFFKLMIAFRKQHANLRRKGFFTGEPDGHGREDIDWHGTRLLSPGWFDPNSRVLAFTLWGLSQDDDIHVMLNMSPVDLDFEIPVSHPKLWLKVIDTAQSSPGDIVESGQEIAISGNLCRVVNRSVVVLISRFL